MHDSNQFETLLTPNSSRDVWADSAYRSEEKEAILDSMNYRSHVQKGNRSAALAGKQIARNKKKSKIRARVEHVFGYQANSIIEIRDGRSS